MTAVAASVSLGASVHAVVATLAYLNTVGSISIVFLLVIKYCDATADRNHDFLMVGARVRRMDRDGIAVYDILDVDVVQRHAYVANSIYENLPIGVVRRIDLVPRMKIADDEMLVRTGQWQLLPNGRSVVPRSPSSYVCNQCLAESSHRPCVSCSGKRGPDHYLVLSVVILDAQAVPALAQTGAWHASIPPPSPSSPSSTPSDKEGAMKLLPSTPTLGKPWPEGEEHASPKCITSIRCTKTAWLYLDPSLTAYSNFNNLGSNNFLMTAFSNFNNFFNYFHSAVSVMVISTMVVVVSASPVSAVPVLPLLVLSQGIAVNAYSGSQQELGADAGANPTVGWVGPVGALALAAALLTARALLTTVCIARKHVCIARKRTAAVEPKDEPPGSPPATPPNGPPSPAPLPPSPAPLHEVPLSSLPCACATYPDSNNIPCAYATPR